MPIYEKKAEKLRVRKTPAAKRTTYTYPIYDGSTITLIPGKDGIPEIVPEEAEIVRYIYRSFMEEKTPNHIAECLTFKHIPTPAGKEIWSPSTIESILTNEKYRGSALLQKSFTVDFLSKKKKINEGEMLPFC